MPKTNLCKPEDKLSVLIRGHYPTGSALARVLRYKAPQTGKARLEDPDKLTRGELRKLVKSGIPAEDILGAIL